MILEDHSGDILRKARQALNLGPSAVSGTVGLSEAELSAWEESGQAPATVNYALLASTLALSAPKLEQIVHGWRPAEPDLGDWREIRRFTTRNGYAVNCYLVWDEVTRAAALFDTGWDVTPALETVREHGLDLQHLFLTHLDEDHIAGMEAVKAQVPLIRIHTNAKNVPPQNRNRANDFIHLGSLRITNRETPGHTEDGVTYIVGNWPEDRPAVAMVGDAIFAGSIGRGKQSWDLAKQKVRENIFSLPADTLLCPGHGPFTTVAEEKQHNPFF